MDGFAAAVAGNEGAVDAVVVGVVVVVVVVGYGTGVAKTVDTNRGHFRTLKKTIEV